MESRVSVANGSIVRRGITIALAAAMTLCPVADGLVLAAAAAVGSLSVSSDPDGAAVYVDGQFVGQTPVQVQRLSAGDHRVRIVKDGYLENGRVVSVTAGTAGTVQVRLTNASVSEPARQAGGGGVSTGEGGSNKKWIYIGAAAGGGVLAAVLLANRNKPPTFSSTPTANPAVGLAAATSISFTTTASDPNGDSLTYSWDFGDGATGTGATTSHVYNAAGNFNVKVKVDDGNGGTAESNLTITVRSLTGTWVGNLFNLTTTLTFTQTGSSFTGTYQDNLLGVGTISATQLRTTTPRITFTVNIPNFSPFTFTGDPSADANTLNGVVNGSGFVNDPWVLRRQ